MFEKSAWKLTSRNCFCAVILAISSVSLKQGLHSLRVRTGPRMCYIRPSQWVKMYKKLFCDDGDFINEFNLHQTIDNFSTYYRYNPK